MNLIEYRNICITIRLSIDGDVVKKISNILRELAANLDSLINVGKVGASFVHSVPTKS